MIIASPFLFSLHLPYITQNEKRALDSFQYPFSHVKPRFSPLSENRLIFHFCDLLQSSQSPANFFL